MTDWQPIETAPKDGTVILLYSPQFKKLPYVVSYWIQYGRSDGWVATFDTPECDGPPSLWGLRFTHWKNIEATPNG